MTADQQTPGCESPTATMGYDNREDTTIMEPAKIIEANICDVCFGRATHRSFFQRKYVGYPLHGWVRSPAMSEGPNPRWLHPNNSPLAPPTDLCGACARSARKGGARAAGDDTIVTHAKLYRDLDHAYDRFDYWKNGRNLFRSTTQEWNMRRMWGSRVEWAQRRADGIDYERLAQALYAKQDAKAVAS